jgi:hypothetical protein
VQIPPLKIASKDLKGLPRPSKTEPWETLTRPTYWFGDRLLTNKGWGICTGIRQISTGDWLYYIQLDKPPHLQSPTQIFIDIEILKHHPGTAS